MKFKFNTKSVSRAMRSGSPRSFVPTSSKAGRLAAKIAANDVRMRELRQRRHPSKK